MTDVVHVTNTFKTNILMYNDILPLQQQALLGFDEEVFRIQYAVATVWGAEIFRDMNNSDDLLPS